MENHSCHHKVSNQHIHKKKTDYLLWSSLSIIVLSYLAWLLLTQNIEKIKYLDTFSLSIFELMNQMSWGLVLGIIFAGLLTKIPKEFVISILGKGGTLSGILRATGAGVLLDLCSHGILVVGAQLYKRGASLGQVMAFLIASPWNSISLTLILLALVGFKWMISFLILSMIIAIISGVIFDILVKKEILAKNPNSHELPEDFKFFAEAKKQIKANDWHYRIIWEIIWKGLKESKMVLRWILFGVILASAVRTFIPADSFETLFGPTLAGLGLTLVVATVLEVCSEGSTPIAADILTRAGAPGNAFGFLMTGVSTDYTEILTLKEATGSWKIAFFLPLVTLPQVIIVSIILNYYS